MSNRYHGTGEQTATAASAANDAVWTLEAFSTVRPFIYDITFGCDEAPADQANSMIIQRFTDAGDTLAGTAITIAPMDAASPAAVCENKSNITAAPTTAGYVANTILLSFSLNQQATFRWVVPPDEGIVIPASDDAGVALRFLTATATADHQSGFYWVE
jgi:hypothetical protein